jgi:DNA replication and repair protein RecF
MRVADLRVIERAELCLGRGLHVFVGDNAQGKTSLLEAAGLLARGRSFRTDETRQLIRRGQPRLRTSGVLDDDCSTRLDVEVDQTRRRLAVDGRDVAPGVYAGRLDVVVYATERLRVVRGPMRERRQFLDRGAAALWPAYRALVRDYERVVRQRNAALLAHDRDAGVWDERLLETGALLRQRRGAYAARLQQSLERGFQPRGESYRIALEPQPAPSLAAEREALSQELQRRRHAEARARLSLAGPHRDQVCLSIDGDDAGQGASSGQARSLLLALTLAAAELWRQERGQPATLLLDDLDSELDFERIRALCERVAGSGQALVTTAHPGWAERLDGLARRFVVASGGVRPA